MGIPMTGNPPQSAAEAIVSSDKVSGGRIAKAAERVANRRIWHGLVDGPDLIRNEQAGAAGQCQRDPAEADQNIRPERRRLCRANLRTSSEAVTLLLACAIARSNQRALLDSSFPIGGAGTKADISTRLSPQPFWQDVGKPVRVKQVG
jgi:hypothetical protein